jgi:hypothetical protein
MVTRKQGLGIYRRYAPIALVLIVFWTGGCATYSPQPLPDWPDPADIQTKSQEGVEVSAGILTDAEAATLYGVDLASVGLQAIWLRIENNSDHTHWLLVSALDPGYFPPDEAAALFKAGLSDEDDMRLVKRFRALAIPLRVRSGETNEGYVLAPMHEGGRFVEASLAGEKHLLQLGFAIPLDDGQFDFEDMKAERIYPDRQREDVPLETLRDEVVAMGCCTLNRDGDKTGDPLNLVLIGSAADVLASLARSGWSFTHRISIDSVERMVGAAVSGGQYSVAPISPLYFMDRQQDIALQRARSTILQRNHLRLWLLPYTVGGRSAWIGQVSRDVSIKPSMTSLGLVTHVIDPNVDEAREHLLQSLMVSGVIRQFGFVRGVGAVPEDKPAYNLSKDPFFTDGLRLFVTLSGTEFIPPERVEFLDWNDSADPIAESRLATDNRAPE